MVKEGNHHTVPSVVVHECHSTQYLPMWKKFDHKGDLPLICGLWSLNMHQDVT